MTAYLMDYSHFNNRMELDEATRKHRKSNWSNLNLTDHLVLEMIWRHSLRFGAAHLSHGDISAKIEKARSTVKCSIRKLEQFGIIDRHHYMHSGTNGLGANIYSIRPFNEFPTVVDDRIYP